MADLTADDLVAGSTYRAKKPRKIWSWSKGECLNDRRILWISKIKTQVQYDGPVIRPGQHYPTVDIDKFLKWASHKVENTDG